MLVDVINFILYVFTATLFVLFVAYLITLWDSRNG